jgi:hypothetical protein
MDGTGNHLPLGTDDVSLDGYVDGQWIQLLYKPSIDIPGSRRLIEVVRPAAAPSPTPQEIAEARLIEHLKTNPVYYTAAIISGGDAALRYLALSGFTDDSGNVLADIVDNTVVGTMGNYLVFPLKADQYLPARYRAKQHPSYDPDERIISLPTPGVFAESQLGHCSACEKIDETRFWD